MANKSYSIEESLKALEKDIKDLSDSMVTKAKQNVQLLAAQAHSMVIKKATDKLKSTRKMYTDAVGLQKIDSSANNEIWAVTLNKSVKWIEDGQPHHSMLDYLLKSPKAKMGKNGKYIIIPFQHNKAPSQTSDAQSKIANYAKNILKEHGLDKTITRDGKPILGKVASIKVNGKQGTLKVLGRDDKEINMGEKQPISKFNKPLLNGLTIYQSEMKNKHGETMKDKRGNAKIKRDIMTFRIASDSQRGSGLWEKNATPGVKIFDEVEKELDVVWDQMVKKLVEES